VRECGDVSRNERGAICVWFVLCMPTLLSVMALVFDVAWASIGQNYLQVAADGGALAGVQEIDLDRLALGECRIVPEPAITVARLYAFDNLSRSLAPEHLASCMVTARAFNPGEPGWHGPPQVVLNPTVCVEVCLPIQFPVTRMWRMLRVHADASLMPHP